MEDKIDINAADVETLASLPGIGLKRAAQIVDYRTAVHPFEEVIELTAVPGISQRMVEAIADLVMVDVPSEPEVAQLETSESEAAEPEGDEPEAVDDGVDETAVLLEADADTETGEETEAETETETAEPDEPEGDEPPVVVTMLEPEYVQPDPPERAIITPPIRPAQQMIVEPHSRRHSHLWQNFLAVVAGAVFGSLLTLLLLFLLNGTLRFAGDSRATDLQLQLDEETSTIRQSQSILTDELGDLSGRVTALDNEQAASEEALGAVADDVAGLEEETADINERLENIDLAAEKFDTFLTGMRDLLISLQGLPSVPSPTATITATTTLSATLTPEAAQADLTPTPTTGAGDGVVPTRTPRPTATPLIENGG